MRHTWLVEVDAPVGQVLSQFPFQGGAAAWDGGVVACTQQLTEFSTQSFPVWCFLSRGTNPI